MAHRIHDSNKRIPGGLAYNMIEERKKGILETIEENVPPSREQDYQNGDGKY